MREQTQMKCDLFLCADNSCRSQMAEGLMREIAGPEFEGGRRDQWSPLRIVI